MGGLFNLNKGGVEVEAEQQGVTIGFREIYDLSKEAADGVRSLKEEFSTFKENAKKADDAYTIATDAQKRVAQIERTLTWVWRTVLGGIILTSIGYAFAHH